MVTVYKLAAGKARADRIMTTLRKPDGSETSSIKETMDVILQCHFPEDREESENQLHKTIRRSVEEPINTRDDTGFSKEEIRQTITSFSDKKAPGRDGITASVYLRKFKLLPEMVTAIYNQCLDRGCFPKRWKAAKIIPIIKPAQENSAEPCKYRPISLLNILEKLLITRITHYLYRHGLLTDKQYGFTLQKSTADAAMEAKHFIKPIIEKRGLVNMASLDVAGAFDSAR